MVKREGGGDGGSANKRRVAAAGSASRAEPTWKNEVSNLSDAAQNALDDAVQLERDLGATHKSARAIAGHLAVKSAAEKRSAGLKYAGENAVACPGACKNSFDPDGEYCGSCEICYPSEPWFADYEDEGAPIANPTVTMVERNLICVECGRMCGSCGVEGYLFCAKHPQSCEIYCGGCNSGWAMSCSPDLKRPLAAGGYGSRGGDETWKIEVCSLLDDAELEDAEGMERDFRALHARASHLATCLFKQRAAEKKSAGLKYAGENAVVCRGGCGNSFDPDDDEYWGHCFYCSDEDCGGVNMMCIDCGKTCDECDPNGGLLCGEHREACTEHACGKIVCMEDCIDYCRGCSTRICRSCVLSAPFEGLCETCGETPSGGYCSEC